MEINMLKILPFLITLVFLNCACADPFDLNKLPDVHPDAVNSNTVILGGYDAWQCKKNLLESA